MYDTKIPGGKVPVPKSALILIAVLVLSVIPLVILISSLASNSSAQTEPAEFVQVTRVHDPEGETVVIAEQVMLYVPKEAIELSGDFVIQTRQPDLFSYAGDSGWTRPVVVDIQYRNADGVPFPSVTFSQPVNICFVLSPEQWTDFSKRPDAYQVQYFDERQIPYRWVSYPLAIDPEEYQLCTQTDHLSIYALAVKEQELIPITGPTSFPTAIPTTATPETTLGTPGERPSRDDAATLPPVNTRPPNPTKKPPTDPPPTEPPPTEPPPTEPPPTEPPPTEEPPPPPPTEEPPPPPPTEEPPPPPPTEEPPSPPTEEPPVDPPAVPPIGLPPVDFLVELLIGLPF